VSTHASIKTKFGTPLRVAKKTFVEKAIAALPPTRRKELEARALEIVKCSRQVASRSILRRVTSQLEELDKILGSDTWSKKE
jgi:hypothetical protein